MDRKYKNTLTTSRTLVVGLIFLALGLVLYIVTIRLSPEDSPSLWLILFRELASLMVLSIPLLLIWELFLKRSFAEELLALIHTSDDILHSKLLQICFDPQEIDWKQLFLEASDIDILLSYGTSWRGNNERLLMDYLSSESKLSGTIRVILPDYHDETILKELSRRFEKTPDGIQERIRSAISDFTEADRRRAKGPRIQIWALRICPVFTCFRFDNLLILSLYSHKGKKEVPHFIVQKGGKLFSFAAEQINNIVCEGSSIAKLVYDSQYRRLPIQVLIFPYYIQNKQIHYLLLRRTQKRGDFWQGVTGGVIQNERIEAAAKRELDEETGFKGTLIQMDFSYKYPMNDEWKIFYSADAKSITEYVFICNLGKRLEPTIDSNEHYQWEYKLYQEAFDILKWDENRKALEFVNAYLLQSSGNVISQ